MLKVQSVPPTVPPPLAASPANISIKGRSSSALTNAVKKQDHNKVWNNVLKEMIEKWTRPKFEKRAAGKVSKVESKDSNTLWKEFLKNILHKS